MQYYEVTTSGDISPIEVERETSDFVYINGRKQAKTSDCNSFFKTREEAKEWLFGYLERKTKEAEGVMLHWQKKLAIAKDKHKGEQQWKKKKHQSQK